MTLTMTIIMIRKIINDYDCNGDSDMLKMKPVDFVTKILDRNTDFLFVLQS